MSRESRKRSSHAQNFLARPAVARQIIARAEIEPDDLVIEIGAGRGMLTRALAGSCRQVLAIEKDGTLARRLAREVRPHGNVALVEGDFLDLPLPLTPYKVVANIPFNITAAIVARLTQAGNPPEEAVLVVQREAAERFVGQPRQTLAAVLLQPWFELSIAARLRQNDFVPPPRVEVVLLRFSKRGPPLVAPEDAQDYRDFVTYGFTAWKPTLREAYGTVIPPAQQARLAEDIHLDLCRRPSEVDFDRWLALFRALRRPASPTRWRVIAGAEERLRARQEGLIKPHRGRDGGG
ncbi:MAG TPA: 23S ribosomal RNA methyltransferase Erm [Thermomicrobiaceae bacterium]|nr:23S ribosomal RNA methyltransferase Erm [Thermomicrobiaceae bacterium]